MADAQSDDLDFAELVKQHVAENKSAYNRMSEHGQITKNRRYA